MKTGSYPITWMSCASCASHIEKKLHNHAWVKLCEVNFATETAKITFDPTLTSLTKMNELIKPMWYELNSNQHEQQGSDSNHFAIWVQEDHTTHLGVHQSKQDKLNELDVMRSNINIIIPFVWLSFLYMVLDIWGKAWWVLPTMPTRLYEFRHHLFPVMATYILFVTGRKYIIAVWRFFKTGIANMETLIGLWTTVAYLYSFVLGALEESLKPYLDTSIHYYDVVIVVIWLVYYGKYLETKSKLKTWQAIEKLLNLQAKTALVERDGQEVEIAIDKVILGDTVLVKPWSKIAVDGVIISWASSVDESMITGESMPVDKKQGDTVIGGTINKQGFLKIQADSLGSDSMLSHIINMVQEAQWSKAPIQKLADLISAYFVPIVLWVALLSLIIWILLWQSIVGLVAFVSVLIIACPCALWLATPTAIIVWVGKWAEQGILIKNAESLQKIQTITTVVFDKTGTITKWKPELVDYIGHDRGADLQILASLEKLSEHPLAEAITTKAQEEGIWHESVSNFQIIEGRWLQGVINHQLWYAGNIILIEDLGLDYDIQAVHTLTSEGKTPILLATSQKVVGIFAVADTIKHNSIQAIKDLHEMRIETVMLSGDHSKTAAYIASLVWIDKVYAEVLPHNKAQIIKDLQAQGKTVAMCGDGVNDAPALAHADIGVAMGTWTDVAIETADVTLLAGDISKLVKAIRLSKATMRTIKQNLWWAFGYNIIWIPLAAGLFYPISLNPIFAGLAMALSSVSVVSNSLRLKRIRL